MLEKHADCDNERTPDVSWVIVREIGVMGRLQFAPRIERCVFLRVQAIFAVSENCVETKRTVREPLKIEAQRRNVSIPVCEKNKFYRSPAPFDEETRVLAG